MQTPAGMHQPRGAFGSRSLSGKVLPYAVRKGPSRLVKEEDMKRIKIALSIAVLLGTMTVVGVSSSQTAFADDEIAPMCCNCEYDNPHSWGIVRDGNCYQQECWIICSYED
jgi:hypothetical protein